MIEVIGIELFAEAKTDEIPKGDRQMLMNNAGVTISDTPGPNGLWRMVIAGPIGHAIEKLDEVGLTIVPD